MSANTTLTFVVSGARSLEARFAQGAGTTYTVTANAATGGTATGGGSYAGGASATVVATPNANYTFEGWYEGSTRVSTNASYTFTVNGNITLEARFTYHAPADNVEVTVECSPSNGGTVTGGGSYAKLSSVTLSCTPNAGFHVVNWQVEEDYEWTNISGSSLQDSITVQVNNGYQNFKCIVASGGGQE